MLANNNNIEKKKRLILSVLIYYYCCFLAEDTPGLKFLNKIVLRWLYIYEYNILVLYFNKTSIRWDRFNLINLEIVRLCLLAKHFIFYLLRILKTMQLRRRFWQLASKCQPRVAYCLLLWRNREQVDSDIWLVSDSTSQQCMQLSCI